MRIHKAEKELRWWFHFADRNCLRVQLARPTFRIGFGIGDFESTLHFQFMGLYASFDFPALARGLTPKLEHHSFSFYWFENALWLEFWGDAFESRWNDPWWAKMHVLHFDDLLFGKANFSKTTGEKFENVMIPMPEGVFTATMIFETLTWKRPRWFAKIRQYTNIEINDKAPVFPGKGENSWDCGDDGIYGMSVEGHSIPKAIGGYVQAVCEYRVKRGSVRHLMLSK